jgi:hypothetical protein
VSGVAFFLILILIDNRKTRRANTGATDKRFRAESNLSLDRKKASFIGLLGGKTGVRANKKKTEMRTRRRAPKVTVTREGDSLCQKGCYPLALVFC